MEKNVFTIRLIKSSEHSRWFQLLNDHHYLGSPIKVVGERLYYVAQDLHGNWLALLGWCAAAMHLYDRDAWIGWSVPVRKLRLRYVANNFRFLILPQKTYPNLASQLLSANLKVLSQDWQTTYSHPIYLAETFVDSQKFHGGCYRASNWICVGKTKGFTRTKSNNSYYKKNEVIKLIFVRSLCKHTEQLLSDPSVAIKNHHGCIEEVLVLDINKLPIERQGGLIDILKQVEDPRRRQGRRHSQLSGLCLATCAMLAGAKGFKGIHQWANNLTPTQRFKMRCQNGKIPGESTIRRMLVQLDAQQFDNIISDWLLKLVANGKITGLAVDGKVLRGSKDGKKKAVHLLSALVHAEKLTVAQSKIKDKENEIPAFKPLIKNLALNNAVVTADAMHCQTDHAIFLVTEKKCGYAFVVKGNQPTLFSETKRILGENIEKSEKHIRTTLGHGRIDERTISLLELSLDHKYYITFPYATHIFKISRRSIEKSTGTESNFEKYGITSMAPQRITAESMLEIMLTHWQIESGHWIRDEVFLEDKSRIRTGSGPQVMAALRNVSIGILRYAGAVNFSETVQNLAWVGPKTSMRAIGVM